MHADNKPLIDQPSWVGRAETLEKSQLDLGFIPLSDCAPLAIAYEKGFFERHGLRVTLRREASWASIRDKTMLGIFDAAHMLYPMPIAMTLGVGGVQCPMVTAMCLSLGGNAITVSNLLYDEMSGVASDFNSQRESSARALKKTIEARRRSGKGPLRFGVVFPTSTHHYELRFWMASAGIDPDADVKVLVVPPPGMPDAMRNGKIDGYCVGEPWNSFTVERGWGKTLITKQGLWNNGPEKVLGTTKTWAEQHPNTHQALVRAVLEACVWSDQQENREEVASIIAQQRYIDAPIETVRMSMLGQYQYDLDHPPQPHPDFMSFHRYAANFPWHSHAKWFMTQMLRWKQLEEVPDFDQVAGQVMLTELYRSAARELGVAAPTINEKSEGTHQDQWVLEQATTPIIMGTDLLIDNRCFDPSDPMGYLNERLARTKR
ncbi:MAG: ABC transporter substrate-binding protein [Phycisphaeraceae bacterium]|nr:ABC transporter substrate-binding protein [Phycisphaeraceae bacterium]